MFDDDNAQKQGDEIAEMQDALGAIAAARPAVFWIFRKGDGRWYARMEGEPGEHGFVDRQEARDFAKIVAARCRSYRVLAQQDDGSFAEVRARWPESGPDAPRGFLHWLTRNKRRGFLT